jgi:lysine 2,3-aminomutase
MAPEMTRNGRRLTSVDDLIRAGLAHEASRSALTAVSEHYAIALTPEIASLIDRDDPNDPIARQFVPDARELETHPAERADPIGDHLKSPVPGIVHRYPDRVLLKIASICPVYCRFCFRREMVGPVNGEVMSPEDLSTALDYIRATPGVWEVILTGGDPLVLSPRRIRDVTDALAAIGHVKVLRWHTRLPVVDPARITDELIAALRTENKTVFIGLHINHPRELFREARTAIGRLVDAGIPIVSQTVLLKGVNDDADTLEALMRALVEVRVKPYYLHHGDLAPGTAHFRTTIAEGRALMAALRRRLSGLALPTYVLDLPGAHGKVPIELASRQHHDGVTFVTDREGVPHRYEDACAAPNVP